MSREIERRAFLSSTAGCLALAGCGSRPIPPVTFPTTFVLIHTPFWSRAEGGEQAQVLLSTDGVTFARAPFRNSATGPGWIIDSSRKGWRPGIWCTQAPGSDIKWAAFYWNAPYTIVSGQPRYFSFSDLLVATLSRSRGLTLARTALRRDFLHSEKVVMSPTAASLNDAIFLVAWGEDHQRLDPWQTATLFAVMTVEFRMEHAVSPVDGTDIMQAVLHSDVRDTGFRTRTPPTLTVRHRGTGTNRAPEYVLGFTNDANTFVLSTSSDGITWSAPIATGIPPVFPDGQRPGCPPRPPAFPPETQEPIPADCLRVYPFHNPVWGPSVNRLWFDDNVHITTVGWSTSGAGGPARLLRFRANDATLSAWTLVAELRQFGRTLLPDYTHAYSVAGPASEPIDAFFTDRLVINAAAGAFVIPRTPLPPPAAPGTFDVPGPPAVDFGHTAIA